MGAPQSGRSSIYIFIDKFIVLDYNMFVKHAYPTPPRARKEQANGQISRPVYSGHLHQRGL